MVSFSRLILPILSWSILTTCLPTAETNFEYYTNSQGYQAIRFKAGMEPGTVDYANRLGATLNNVSSTSESSFRIPLQIKTSPVVGQAKMPYGCDTNIPATVLDRLHTICHDGGCDESARGEVKVEYPVRGNKVDATITLKASGVYPPGHKHAFIQAIQALAIPEAVETTWVENYGTVSAAGCNVPHSSSFFQIGMFEDIHMVGNMKVELVITVDGGGVSEILYKFETCLTEFRVYAAGSWVLAALLLGQ